MIKNTHGWAEGTGLKRKKTMDMENSVVIAGMEGEGGGYGGMNGDDRSLTWGGEHTIQWTVCAVELCT